VVKTSSGADERHPAFAGVTYGRERTVGVGIRSSGRHEDSLGGTKALGVRADLCWGHPLDLDAL
jgi:hypothetical protein